VKTTRLTLQSYRYEIANARKTNTKTTIARLKLQDERYNCNVQTTTTTRLNFELSSIGTSWMRPSWPNDHLHR